jgi:hypothetical protein
VKISIINQSWSNLTFDILIRDYFDTDSNPVVLEKFTNCGMDPGQNSFIGVKIGTLDGEYALNSKYIMIEISEDAPIDALPCGFNGFNFRSYQGAQSPFPIIKAKYDYPGEVIWNPPFGLGTGVDDIIVSSGDNIRRTYLGIGNFYGWDPSYYEYIGNGWYRMYCCIYERWAKLSIAKGSTNQFIQMCIRKWLYSNWVI